jgi:phosphatidylglycerol:prolipoprotein diacylglycerol transferase
MILRRNKKIRLGVIVGIYLMWYGIVRFFIESLRTDALMLGDLKMAQVISIVSFIIGLISIILSRKKELYNKEIIIDDKKSKKERKS